MNNVLVASLFSKLKRTETQLEKLENKRVELIEEITVDKDNVLVIERNQEPNGTLYSFEEVFVYLETDISTTSSFLNCRVNDIAVLGISDLIGTEKKYSTIQLQANKGLLLITYQNPVVDKTWVSNIRTRTIEGLFVETIKSLKFICNIPIPVGTRIAIYAVRK